MSLKNLKIKACLSSFLPRQAPKGPKLKQESIFHHFELSLYSHQLEIIDAPTYPKKQVELDSEGSF